jgi:predicted PurR-regulated permease PerM
MNKDNLAKKAFVYASTAALIIIIILLLKEVVQVLLLIFAGILLAIFFRGIAYLFMKYIKVNERWALIIGISTLFLLVIISSFLMGPGISESINDLRKEIPAAADELEKTISSYSWGEDLIKNVKESANEYLQKPEFRSRITGIFSSMLTIITGILIIFVIGLYIAFHPREYSNGFLKLFPQKKRERMSEILSKLEHALLWWMVGRFSSMAIVGVLTIIGLLILDVQLAVPLGILAALFSFVPNLGPIASAIPAVAMGFIDSPQKAFYVVLLYIGTQLIETYLITPQIQKKVVSISPALLLSMEIIIGVLLGIFGLVLATPLMVVIIVLIQTLYIQDTLNDDVEVLGE